MLTHLDPAVMEVSFALNSSCAAVRSGKGGIDSLVLGERYGEIKLYSLVWEERNR